MALLDPNDARRSALRDAIERANDYTNALVAELSALGASPDGGSLIRGRIEFVVDQLLPPERDEQGLPTNVERLEFELAWQEELAEGLADALSMVRKAQLSSPGAGRLVVPGGPVNMKMPKPRTNGGGR